MDFIKKILETKDFWRWAFNLISAVISTIIICSVGYYHYIEKNVLGDKQLAQLTLEVEELQKHAKKTDEFHQNSLLNDEKLESEIHTLDLKFMTLSNKLSNTISYQSVLRTEVKALAENKLNTVDFWRLMNNLFTRIRYLEEKKP